MGASITRKIELTTVEAVYVYQMVNKGDPQRGNTLADLRAIDGILNQLEEAGNISTVEGGLSTISFKDSVTLSLKESEYQKLINLLNSSFGFPGSARKEVFALEDKLKECPMIEEKKEKEGVK